MLLYPGFHATWPSSAAQTSLLSPHWHHIDTLTWPFKDVGFSALAKAEVCAFGSFCSRTETWPLRGGLRASLLWLLGERWRVTSETHSTAPSKSTEVSFAPKCCSLATWSPEPCFAFQRVADRLLDYMHLTADELREEAQARVRFFSQANIWSKVRLKIRKISQGSRVPTACATVLPHGRCHGGSSCAHTARCLLQSWLRSQSWTCRGLT